MRSLVASLSVSAYDSCIPHEVVSSNCFCAFVRFKVCLKNNALSTSSKLTEQPFHLCIIQRRTLLDHFLIGQACRFHSQSISEFLRLELKGA